MVVPMHSDNPDMLQILCPDTKIKLVNDGEEVTL